MPSKDAGIEVGVACACATCEVDLVTISTAEETCEVNGPVDLDNNIVVDDKSYEPVVEVCTRKDEHEACETCKVAVVIKYGPDNTSCKTLLLSGKLCLECTSEGVPNVTLCEEGNEAGHDITTVLGVYVLTSYRTCNIGIAELGESSSTDVGAEANSSHIVDTICMPLINGKPIDP